MNFASINYADSMSDILMELQGNIKCYKLNLQDFIELSNREKIYGYFSNNDKPIVKKLMELGIKYEPINDKITLNPTRKDVLYVIKVIGYKLRNEYDEIPNYSSIEVRVYETSCEGNEENR